ncbi:MAG: hypothetical protein QY304_03045 [Candidatus Paceibacterota bacterium]|nr:MAG: hypothetical protein QY304_03045 [Candidatus Paceibacterota bacterium]
MAKNRAPLVVILISKEKLGSAESKTAKHKGGRFFIFIRVII